MMVAESMLTDILHEWSKQKSQIYELADDFETFLTW